MKQKLLAAVLSLVMILTLLPTTAFATAVSGESVTEVASYEALAEALRGTASTIKLTGNIESDKSLSIAAEKNFTIDLNGYSITRKKAFDGNSYVGENGAVSTAPTLLVMGTLTLKDSQKGGSVNSAITVANGIVSDKKSVRNCAVWVDGGTFTMESGTISATTNGDVAIGVYMTKLSSENASSFTMNGGSIKVGATDYLGNAYGVYVGGSSNKATFNMTGGTINALAQVVLPNADGSMSASAQTGDAHGVHVDGNGNTGSANGVFNMTGGKIISKGFGISGNDDCNGTDIDIKNGEIEGYAAAIYHPQAGTLDIENSTLTGTSGLEAKGGTINIKGGIFNSLLEQNQGGRTYGDEQNHGNSTKGWAVAAVNNSSYKTDGVSITIDGGTYNAPVGVLDDSAADTNAAHSYKITIKDGTFNSIVRMYGYDTGNYTSAASTVKPAETDSIVIEGGSFTHDPMYHVADGKTAVKDTSGYHKIVAATAVQKVSAKEATCKVPGNKEYYTYTAKEGESPVACYLWDKSYASDMYKWSNADNKPFYVYYTNTDYLIPLKAHNWEQQNRTEPTETAEGSISYKCSACETSKTDKLEPTGVHHDTSEQGTLQHHDAVSASCANLTNGTKEYWTCSNNECADKKFVKDADGNFVEASDSELTVPWAHTLKTLSGKAASCTGTGLTDGTQCTACNAIITPQAEIPAKGHTRGAKTTETTPATDTENGASYEVIRCTDCDTVLSKTVIAIPAGHEHSWDDGVVTKEATTGSTGIKTYTCKDCRVTKTEVIAKLHKSGSGSSGNKVTVVKDDPVPVETSSDFVDVTSADWFAEAVDYVVEKGMMNGTGKTTFSPKSGTTRGMIVTVLYRLENEPSTLATSFTDVSGGQYYANAVAWANKNGIVSGYGNGKFGPNDSITREQLAAILYRYAQYKNYDVSAGEDTNIMDFDDTRLIGSYAVPAIQWACGAGVMNGKSATTLDPKGGATRAEVAAMLMRFCENVK